MVLYDVPIEGAEIGAERSRRYLAASARLSEAVRSFGFQLGARLRRN